jgi:ChrB-like protein
MSRSWTVLVYRIPSQPSRLRLQIWRRLQALGVLYLQDAVCVLPAKAELDGEFLLVEAAIREMGGSAHLFLSSGMLLGEDERIIEDFKTAADERYAAIQIRVDAAIESLRRKVDISDIEAAEESLKRERVAYLRSQRIAYFGGTIETEVEAKLEELRRLLDDIRIAFLG